MNKKLEQKIDDILKRGIVETIDKNHLKKKLLSGKKLRVKFGIDPTAKDLHLGHSVPLRKLKQFQNLGHKIILLIGDFTAMIGDPAGRKEARKVLSRKEVRGNMKTYIKQAGKILNMKKVEVRYNSEWYDKLGAEFIFDITSKFTVARTLERDDFKKRLKEDVDISVLEIIYPLLQGYDSVELNADLEIGGNDQRFNLLTGRKVQRRYGKQEQDIMMLPLLEGTDGVNKMSKGYDNHISLMEKAETMFGKIMSIPDGLIIKYYTLLTEMKDEEIKKMKDDIKMFNLNPRDAKLELATEIVTIYHGEKEAKKAQENFVNTFSKKSTPSDVAEFKAKSGMKLTEILVKSGNATSASDARRKIEQGGVKVDNKKITDWKTVASKSFNNKIVKIGKFSFVKIKFQ